MSRYLAPTLLPLASLFLASCETTSSDNWNTQEPNVPFADAETTCEEQTENIEDEENRPEFFVDCMEALGWFPEPGTPFATPEDAPDPS